MIMRITAKAYALLFNVINDAIVIVDALRAESRTNPCKTTDRENRNQKR